MSYKIDLSSLPKVQKRNIWNFVDWREVPSTAYDIAVGVLISFLALAIFTEEWHLSLFGWIFLTLAITCVTHAVNALKEREKAYDQEKKYQESWPIEKVKRLNFIINQSEHCCSECRAIRNQIASEIENAKYKYNRNLFGQYWDMIESITESFDDYRSKINILERYQKDYQEEVRTIDANHNFPSTTLNMNMVPLVNKELIEFKNLRELGESHRDFANIWEQRRTREAIITGFKNLQDSVEGVGDAITREVRNLHRRLEE